MGRERRPTRPRALAAEANPCTLLTMNKAPSKALSAQDKQCLQQSIDRLQNAHKVKDPLGFLTSEGTARLCCGSRGTAQTYTYRR